jgi:hypothetical protein
MNPNVETEAERANSGRQLLGGVGRTVIQDQVEDADPLAPEAGEQHPQKHLKFTKPLPVKATRQRFPAVHQEAGKQLHRAFALVPIAHMQGMAGPRGGRAACGLPSLDRCFSSAHTMIWPFRLNSCARSYKSRMGMAFSRNRGSVACCQLRYCHGLIRSACSQRFTVEAEMCETIPR